MSSFMHFIYKMIPPTDVNSGFAVIIIYICLPFITIGFWGRHTVQRIVVLNSYLWRLVIDNKYPGITGSLPVCPLGVGDGDHYTSKQPIIKLYDIEQCKIYKTLFFFLYNNVHFLIIFIFFWFSYFSTIVQS